MAERDRLVEALADLAVVGGANLQRGQILALSTEPGKEELTRAVAASAYRHGAKFVDVWSFDLHVKRARVLYGADEDLEYVPPWYGERLRALGEHRAARVGLTGPVEPTLFDGLDPARLARDPLPRLPEAVELVNAQTTNWTLIPCPTPEWAALVHGDGDGALDRLWEDVARVCRLDADDPSAAWRARADQLVGIAERLTAARLDALRFTGPGTDLTVGLLGGSRWLGGRMETVGGIVHVPNLPTEEVFTAPDPQRVDGEVRSTKPLVLGGTTVRGLRVRFEGGRAVSIEADEGGEVLAELTRRDEGAARLGEVALVDRESRVGALDRVFYDTLLDENAASHVALGAAYAVTVSDEDRERVNTSVIHIDFMIGGDDVRVTGIAPDGAEVPVLEGGVFRL
ncbi:MAG TPA: aminopeptidase [Solirubrobacteraceae bacterium]